MTLRLRSSTLEPGDLGSNPACAIYCMTPGNSLNLSDASASSSVKWGNLYLPHRDVERIK